MLEKCPDPYHFPEPDRQMEMGKGGLTHLTRSSHSRAVEGLLPLPGTHPAPRSPPHLTPTPSSDYSAGHFPKHRADRFVDALMGASPVLDSLFAL